MMTLERFVAIDHVCAWPQLTRLADGRLSAILFNQPTHGRTEGQVECWLSDDDGRMWRKAGVPVRHGPGENRMNHAVGLAADNSLLVIVSGFDGRPPAGSKTEPANPSNILDPIVSRSSDGGHTWHVTSVIRQKEVAGEGWALIPNGPIVTLESGRMLAAFYHVPQAGSEVKNISHTLLFISDDQGRTWRKHTTIAADNYNECALLGLDQGRVLAAVRTAVNQTLDLYISDDAGDTWRKHANVTGAYEHPGHLLKLPDGRVLLTYGVRHPHGLGLACRVSPDRGESWRRPHAMLTIDEGEHYDAGYPSCVLVGEDHIVTVYYTKRSPAHQRYHMAAAIWNWREEFKRGFDK